MLAFWAGFKGFWIYDNFYFNVWIQRSLFSRIRFYHPNQYGVFTQEELVM